MYRLLHHELKKTKIHPLVSENMFSQSEFFIFDNKKKTKELLPHDINSIFNFILRIKDI